MPNGTYGGVRGRKTKVGGKLTTFVFLLLDYHNCAARARFDPNFVHGPGKIATPCTFYHHFRARGVIAAIQINVYL